MKKVLIVVVFWIGLTGSSARSQTVEVSSKVTAAASAWLALTDAGKYSQSWDAAASLFRSAVTSSDWVKALTATRVPLGAVRTRKLKSTTVAHSLPGVPDGEYVILQYDTVFEKKTSALETVTPMKEKDGTWRVSGYFIK
jgi:hypothetical protein